MTAYARAAHAALFGSAAAIIGINALRTQTAGAWILVVVLAVIGFVLVCHAGGLAAGAAFQAGRDVAYAARMRRRYPVAAPRYTRGQLVPEVVDPFAVIDMLDEAHRASAAAAGDTLVMGTIGGQR